MKNYLVQTLTRVRSTNYGWKDRKDEGDLYSLYQHIQKLSKASYDKFLQGEWEYVLLEKEVDNVLEVFQNNFKKIYELRKSGECNILFCGLDTQMLKPTEVFDQYADFLMFNYTDPRSNSLFQHNYNCDIRYYPAEMDMTWWEFSLEEAEKIRVWEDEQNIYNAMMWSQGLDPAYTCRPTMAYQGFMMPDLNTNREYADRWNGCSFDDAHMVHWHSSRGAQNRIDIMTAVSHNVDIKI